MTLSKPIERGQNRLPYYVQVTAKDFYVEGPIPTGTRRHTWPFATITEAYTFADAMNASWQCGRSTGRQDSATSQALKA